MQTYTDLAATQQMTHDHVRKLFVKLINEEYFDLHGKVMLCVTPDQYMDALNLPFTAYDPFRLQIGNYNIYLDCTP